MKSKEKIKKDISLAFDFLEYLVAHPKELNKIKNNSSITFLDDSKTVLENIRTGKAGKTTSSPRNYVKVKKEFQVVAEPPAAYRRRKKSR